MIGLPGCCGDRTACSRAFLQCEFRDKPKIMDALAEIVERITRKEKPHARN